MIDPAKAYVGIKVIRKSDRNQFSILNIRDDLSKPFQLDSPAKGWYSPKELDYADPEPDELKVGDLVEVVNFNEYQNGSYGIIRSIQMNDCFPYCVKFTDCDGSLCLRRHNLRKVSTPTAEASVKFLLGYIGDDPKREGLKETPSRVIRAYADMFSGYGFSEEDIANTCKTFEDGSCDEIVILKDISFYSTCEHHMLPFVGVAHIGYLPDKRIIGLSKLARLLEIYSRRLQVQERLTQQVTQALDKHLQPRGSACVVEAQHLCLACRGVRKPGATMITSSLTGSFRDDPATRSEFLQFVRG